MKKPKKDRTFLNLLIRHNKKESKADKLLGDARNDLFTANEELNGRREIDIQNINLAVNEISAFDENDGIHSMVSRIKYDS